MRKIVASVVILVFAAGILVLGAEEVKVPFKAIKFTCYSKIDISKAEFLLSEVGKECVKEDWLEANLPQSKGEDGKETKKRQAYLNIDFGDTKNEVIKKISENDHIDGFSEGWDDPNITHQGFDCILWTHFDDSDKLSEVDITCELPDFEIVKQIHNKWWKEYRNLYGEPHVLSGIS